MEQKNKSKLRSLSKPKLCSLFCCISLVSFIAIGVVLVALTQMEIVRDVKTINPDGKEGDVFVVFRPGISSFQEDMINAFVEGLVENDWKIDITTSSSQTPTNVEDYDLLVLGTPTYGGKPHQSLLDYLDEVKDLNGTKTVIIVTSGGSDDTLKIMEDEVEKIDGDIIESLSLYTMKDNGGDPKEICYKAGKDIKGS